MVDKDKGQPKNKSWPECCKDCTHEWQSKELTPDSNELLNIFLMILGGLAFFIGIMGYFPTIFAGITLPADLIAWISVLGPTNFILGAFALLAGIGMFKEQEWAFACEISSEQPKGHGTHGLGLYHRQYSWIHHQLGHNLGFRLDERHFLATTRFRGLCSAWDSLASGYKSSI